MNEISQEEFAAGWLTGLEFILWRRALSERRDEQTQRLRDLSEAAGGWWTFDFPRDKARTFVPMPDWLKMFAADPQRTAWADEGVR